MKLTDKEKNRISELYSSKLNLNESKLNEFRGRILHLLTEQILLEQDPQSSNFLKNLQQKNKEDQLMKQLNQSGTAPRVVTTTQKPKLTNKEIEDVKKFVDTEVSKQSPYRNYPIDDPGTPIEIDPAGPIPFTTQAEGDAFRGWVHTNYPQIAEEEKLARYYPEYNTGTIKSVWNRLDLKSRKYIGQLYKEELEKYKYQWSNAYTTQGMPRLEKPEPFDDKLWYGKNMGDIRDYQAFKNKKFLYFVINNFPQVAKDYNLYHRPTFNDLVKGLYVTIKTPAPQPSSLETLDKTINIDYLKKLKAKEFGFGKEVIIGDEWYYYTAYVLGEWKNELGKQKFKVPSWVDTEIERETSKTFISQQGTKPKKMIEPEEYTWFEKLSDEEKVELHNNMEIVRDVLGTISFIIGWIPHPIAQGIAYAADASVALTYVAEGDNYTAGLEMLGVLGDVVIDRVGGKTMKFFTNLRNTNRLKKLGDALAQEKKDGVNSLDLFTKTEMQAMDAIANRESLQKIKEGMDQYQKDIIDEYLKDPSKFKMGYNKQKFINTKRPPSRFGDPDYGKKYWDDYWRRWGRFSATSGLVAAQGLAHTSVEWYLKPAMKEAIPRDDVDKKIKETIHKLGTTYQKVINEFGGDINNKSDIEKFERAWFSPEFKSKEFGVFVNGWRPDIVEHDTGNTVSNLPCEYLGSLRQQEWESRCKPR